MKIIDDIENKLYLGISKIPGAGVGIFTGINIPAGIPICEYKGEVFDSLESLMPRYEYTLSGGYKTPVPIYSLKHLPTGKIIDSHPSLCSTEIGLGGFANDPQNHLQRKNRPENIDSEYLNEAGYTSYFWHVPGEVKALLMSFREIKAGEEILVDYGDEYWQAFEKREKEVPPKKEEEGVEEEKKEDE
jgi:hypothetical protein